MFSEIITSTAFTGEDANALFGDKVPCSVSPSGDVSLVSTMRALIYPRMAEGSTLHINYAGYPYYTSVDTMLLPEHLAPESFTIIDCNSASKADMDSIFTGFKSDFRGIYNNYEEAEVVEGFFAKSFPMLCFFAREIHSTIVLVQRLDNRKLHYLQTALLVMMPWYHGSRESVSEDELALVMSLKDTSSAEYKRCLNKLIKQYDLREAKIRRLLTGFETSIDKARKAEVEHTIASVDSEIRRYEDAIADRMRQRNESLITLMGLENKIADTEGKDSELMGYILRNHRISLHGVYRNSVTIAASDYIEYYDEDMVERGIDNRRGPVFTRAESLEAREDMAELMTKIFVDKQLRLRVSAAYQITAGERVDGQSGYEEEGMYDDCMPNPHIFEYACLGNYRQILDQLIRNNDYIGIVDQCLASVRSLNWGDSSVMNRFADYMYDDQYRCIELPDGSVVYPSEAIAWIKSEHEREAQEDKLRAICFEEDDDENEAEEEQDE